MPAICFLQKNIETTHHAGTLTSTAANKRPSEKKLLDCGQKAMHVKQRNAIKQCCAHPSIFFSVQLRYAVCLRNHRMLTGASGQHVRELKGEENNV